MRSSKLDINKRVFLSIVTHDFILTLPKKKLNFCFPIRFSVIKFCNVFPIQSSKYLLCDNQHTEVLFD